MEDGFVHTVLGAQEGYDLRLMGYKAFDEGNGKSATQGCHTLYGGGQLARIACQHHTRHTMHGNPTGGFQSLGGLIDKKGGITFPRQQGRGGTCKGAGHYTGFAQQGGANAELYFLSSVFEPGYFFMPATVMMARLTSQFADGLAYGP